METMGPWMLLLLHLHLVVCVSLPAPSSVSISSFNMEHTLSFLPGLGTPSDSRFTVQTVLRLRKKTWRPVAACLKLTAGQTCNLTRAFKDPLNHYQARVQAFTPTQTSNWTMSGQFQPLSDTVLGPPDVSVSGCGNCLLLQLRVPTTNGPQQLKQWYRRVVLDVRRSRDGVQFSLSLPYKEENMISYLQPGVEYCVTVVVKSLFNSNCVSSKPCCVFTSPPRSRSSLYVVFSLLGAFCLLGFLLIGLVVCAGQLGITLQTQPLHRALSIILLQCRNHGSGPVVVSDEISALQQHKEGSADCLLTATKSCSERHWAEDQKSCSERHWAEDQKSCSERHWAEDQKSCSERHWAEDQKSCSERHWAEDQKSCSEHHWAEDQKS
ncbi:interferon alpha/beta receptor 2-like [Cyclopterus lumpus]|uniref:Uncharacterized protein n=1 Tax=Cyclopterus lumpus TaxID=8103 RepID=A0A8C2WPZ3_CYCLU|nr:interferon alpha/beta receptor 2-like [Cyclopterus lumpus]